MQKWEYLIVDTQNVVQKDFSVIDQFGPTGVLGGDITQSLPAIGEQGWELVFCYR